MSPDHTPRRYSARSSLLLLLIVLLMVQDVCANPQTQNLSCPALSELRSELAIRRDKLIKLKSGLEDFMTGKKAPGIPLAALFMIDLTDDNAIRARVTELQLEIVAANAAAKPQDPFLVCASSMEGLRALTNEVRTLQRAVTGLRLRFLTLAPETRAAMLSPQMEATEQANTVKELQGEHSSALEEQKQAAKSLANAEQQALTTETGDAGDIIAMRAELERIRSDLTALQVKWVSNLEQQVAFYQETSERLAEIARVLMQPESLAILETEYKKSGMVWRELVDNTPKVVSSRYALALPPLPDYPVKLLSRIGNTPEARQYIDAYAQTKEFRNSLKDKIDNSLQEGVDLHYRVLLQSGEIRSQLLNQLLDQGDHSPLAINSNLFQDIRREITIVPYRWTATFYLRSLDIRNQLSQGWKGLVETAASFAVPILFFTVPWLLWVGTRHLSSRLNNQRVVLVRQSKTNLWASKLALAIQKILPFFPWLVMLLAVYIAQKLLVLTVFSELALLLPYFRYYIYYRLFRQIMQCDYLWVNRQIRAAKLWGLRREVDAKARLLGRLTFLIFCLLAAIESLIRRGLMYHFMTTAILDLGLLIALGFAYQWRAIIGGGLAKLIPGALGQKLAKLCNSRWGLILSIPAFFVLIFLLLLRKLGNWGSHFEVTKRIAAEVFRYQLESAIDKDDMAKFTPPPLEYRNTFTLSGVAKPEQLVMPATAGINEICSLLKNWANETSSVNSLAILGHKGTGKTCLLQYLEQYVPNGHFVRAAAPAKLTTRKQVLKFIGQLLNVPLSSYPDALKETGSDRPKTLLLIDDAHNFFLSTEGGFEGFNTLLELISRPARNLFWCLDFNYHAWTYLNNVYSQHQYFGAVVRLTPWPEQAIQEMILSMHARTAFQLSYDDIIEAAGSQYNTDQVAYIENRFFSLLRQQSRGNPRLAIYLWLSALRQVGDKALRVGLPEEPEIDVLSDLPEDVLFVFASIARHENLTLRQTVAVTQLPEGIVRHVLDRGVRQKLLDCEEDRIYRLAILYQYPLINYMQAKHYLYE